MTNVPIYLSDEAAARIKELTLEKEGAVGVKMSIVQGRGCGGNEYRMERIFQEEPGLDKIIVDNDIALYIPITDSFMMFGMAIDHGRDAVGNEQFIFRNPNEGGRCGCGESFSLDPEKLAKAREDAEKASS